MIKADKLINEHIHYHYDTIDYTIFLMNYFPGETIDLTTNLAFLPSIGNLVRIEPDYFRNIGYFETIAGLGFETSETLTKYFCAFEMARQGLIGPAAQYTASRMVMNDERLKSFEDDLYIKRKIQKLKKGLREQLKVGDVEEGKCCICHSNIDQVIPTGEDEYVQICTNCNINVTIDERLNWKTIRAEDSIPVIELLGSESIL